MAQRMVPPAAVKTTILMLTAKCLRPRINSSSHRRQISSTGVTRRRRNRNSSSMVSRLFRKAMCPLRRLEVRRLSNSSISSPSSSKDTMLKEVILLARVDTRRIRGEVVVSHSREAVILGLD